MSGGSLVSPTSSPQVCAFLAGTLVAKLILRFRKFDRKPCRCDRRYNACLFCFTATGITCVGDKVYLSKFRLGNGG